MSWPSLKARLNTSRALKFTQEARALMEAEDWENAEVFIRKANNLDPKNPEVIRLIVEYTEQEAPDQAIAFLKALQQLDRAGPEDDTKLLEIFVRNYRLDEAEPLVEKFLARDDTPSPTIEIIAEYYRRKGDQDRQIQLLKLALKKDPGNLEAQLSYAQAQLLSPIPDIINVGWSRIIEIARDPGLAGLRALETIRPVHENFLYPQEKLLDLYRNHPKRSKAGDPSLALLEWDLHLHPGQRPQTIANALDAWAASISDSKELNTKLLWLNEHGHHIEVGAFLSDPERLHDPDLISAAVQALVIESRFDIAKSLINALGQRGDPALSAIGEAFVAFDQNESDDTVDKLIHRAIRTSIEEEKPEYVLRMAYASLRLNRYDPAKQAFRASLPHDPARAHRGLALLAEHEGDLYTALNHLEALGKINPDDITLTERIGYLRLLLNRHVQDARNDADRLLADDPENSVARLLVAFHYLREDNKRRAYEHSKQIDPAALDDRQQAVLAAIRFSMGDYNGAQKPMNKISPYSFSRQDIQFLEQTGVLSRDS
jgi:tetratricopeptide (TPR) repeat protein